MKTNLVTQKLKQHRVLPILVSNDIQQAIRCVQTLAENGLPLVEITLRTPNAINIIKEVVKACPGVCVGAGTILNQHQLTAAQDAGAAFGISPGITPTLARAAADGALPYIPGVSSPSDVMLALECGFDVLKLFPADLLGGAKMTQALAGPFPETKFCITGGVSLATMSELLRQPNVLCVGGSWPCPSALVNANDWAAIAQLASEAVKTANEARAQHVMR